MDIFDRDFTGGTQWGGKEGGFDTAKDLTRTREAEALGRKAPQIDYTDANASLANAAALQQGDSVQRGQQTGALNALQSQAAGGTASSANINAGLGSQAAFQAALQGQASGRTGLANAAMSRQALQAGGMGQLANAQQAGMARQQEYANANQAFGSYAGDVRQGDYASALSSAKAGGMMGQMATAQGQQNLSQQQLNQMYAEDQMRQRYNIGQYQVQGEEAALNRWYGDRSQGYQNALNDQEALMGLIGAGTSAAGSLMAGATAYGSSGGTTAAPMGGNAATAGSSINNSASSFNQAYAMPTSPSDTRTKEAAWDVAPLYEPEGMQLHQGFDGKAFYQSNPQESGGGGMQVPSLASAAASRPEKKLAEAAAAPAKKHEMSYDELMAAANAMEQKQNAFYGASLGQGASVGPDQGVLADANRTMAGSPYRYKPEFVPPDEVPGQIHHGFMAQNLEQNPVTATAVQVDPKTGMKHVHGQRMLQAVASGVSDLQRQVDEMRGGK